MGGLPLPTVQCLRAKVGLPPKGRKKNYFDEENKDSDEEWTPRNRCLKKKVFKTTENTKADLERRRKWIEKYLLNDKEGNRIPYVEEKSGNSKPKQSSKEVEKIMNEVRRSERKVEKVDYTIPSEIREDDFLYCDECGELHFEVCPIHGKFPHVKDTLVKEGIKQHARKTCPEGIYVDTSSIRNSGEGIWTRKDIEKNTVFGPYAGEKIHRKDVKNLRKVMEGGYSWEVIYLCLNASFKC